MSEELIYKVLVDTAAAVNNLKKLSSATKTDLKKVAKNVNKIEDELARVGEAGKKGGKKASEGLGNVGKEAKNAQVAVDALGGSFVEWWKRFGQVAIGFGIAYRLINAVEAGVSRIAEIIEKADQSTGELVSTAGKIAMWSDIIGISSGTVGESFEKAKVNAMALAEASVNVVSGLGDLSQAVDEFAQGRQIIGPERMQELAYLADFVNMVAKTSTSAANQMRQEIQGLMEGTNRVSNTLVRMLSKLHKISDEELAGLRDNTVDASIIVDRVLKFAGKYYGKYAETIIYSDQSKAAEKYSKTLELLITRSKLLAGATEEYGSVFGAIYKKHIEGIKANEKLASTIENLAYFEVLRGQLLDLWLTTLEETINVLGRLSRVIYTVLNAMTDDAKETASWITKIELASVAFLGLSGVIKVVSKALGALVKIPIAAFLSPLGRALSAAIALATLMNTQHFKDWGERAGAEGQIQDAETQINHIKKLLKFYKSPEVEGFGEALQYSVMRDEIPKTADEAAALEDELRKLEERVANSKKALEKPITKKSWIEDLKDSVGELADEIFGLSKGTLEKFYKEHSMPFGSILKTGEGISGSGKGVDAEVAALDNLEKKWKAFLRTPQQAYKISAEELKKLAKAGRISEEELSYGLEKLRKQLLKTSSAARNMASEWIRFSETPLDRYNHQLERLNRAWDANVISADTYLKSFWKIQETFENTSGITAYRQELESLLEDFNKLMGYGQDSEYLKRAFGFANLVAEGMITPEQFDEALERLKQQYSTAGKVMEEYSKDVNDSISGMVSSTMDTLVQGMKTGEFNFTQLINSMIESIIRLITQIAILDPILKSITGSDLGSSLLSFLGLGGSSGSYSYGFDTSGFSATGYGATSSGFSASLTTGASGAWIGEPMLAYGLNSGSLSLFGESGPERVVPQDEYVSGRSGNVVINIENKGVEKEVQAKTRVNAREMVVSLLLEDSAMGGPTAGLFRRSARG